MTLDKSYQDSLPCLFAGNAGTLRLTGAAANGAVSVKALFPSPVYGVGPDWEVDFTVTANSAGSVSLDLKALLTSIETYLFGADSNFLPRALTVRFTGTSSDGTSAVCGMTGKRVYRGRIPESILDDVYDGVRLLGLRPQTYVTRKDASETAVFLNRKGYSTYALYARVYFDDGSTDTFTLASSSSASSASLPFAKDVSYSKVRAAADAAGYEDDGILAYDIYLVLQPGDGDSEDLVTANSNTLRYVIDTGRAEAFRFRGRFGVMENIWAKGCEKSEVESEPVSFTNGGKEEELSNDGRIVRETFTGNLASAEEARFWREFFLSSERYIRIDGDDVPIIIDDIDTEGTEGELAAFSFKWHYADRDDDPARIPARTGLKPYGADALWYETAAEADKTVLKSGLKGVKVSGGSGEHILPQDGDGYANLEIGSPLAYGGDGMGVVWESEL